MTALKILTSSAMKIAESIAVEKGSSYMELMEQAGKGAADRILGLADVSGKQVDVYKRQLIYRKSSPSARAGISL